jgi:hypothetical protein
MAENLRLAFQRSLGTKWDKLILVATVPWNEWNGPDAVVHVECLVPFGKLFSAQLEEGVRWKNPDDVDLGNRSLWETIDTPWPILPSLTVWFNSIAGAKYDILGAISSGIGHALRVEGMYFCSDIANQACSRMGSLGNIPLPCPYVLRKWLLRSLDRKTTYTSMASINDYHATIQQHYATLAATPGYDAAVQEAFHAVQCEQLAKARVQ